MLQYYILNLFLLYLSLLDIRYRKLPNKILLLLFLIGLIFLPSSNSVMTHILGILCPSLFLILCNLLGQHFIGGGDIKLMACMGLFTGGALNCFLFLIASILLLSSSLILKCFRLSYKSLPFCPFVCLSYNLYLLVCIF